MRFEIDDPKLIKDASTLWEQEQLRQGICTGGMLYIHYSHSEEDVIRTVHVCSEALEVVKKALDCGDSSRFLLAGGKQEGIKRLV